jgi:predicted helicase
LVKNPSVKTQKATIHYHDIGDYLSREEKLVTVKKYCSVANMQMQWKTLSPNEHGDWISLRNDAFNNFIPLAPEKKFDVKTHTLFNTYAIGVATNRDAWVYNFSKKEVESNMKRMIAFYNEQQKQLSVAKQQNPKLEVDKFIDTNPTNISWTVNLKKDLEKGMCHKFNNSELSTGMYRPFCKQNLYFDKPFIERPGINPKLFPNNSLNNLTITCHGLGGNKEHSVLLTNSIVDLNCLEAGAQCFPLYYYEERQKQGRGLFDTNESGSEYIRRDGVSDFILDRAKKQYGKNVTKEDIFYYVYGLLHSPEYRTMFANDLKKLLPRLPLVEDVREFWAFSKAGRKLAELHINYETVPAYEGVEVIGADSGFYTVEMRFPKKDQKDSIIYNSKITVTNIPAKAYEYVVNGKSAIEWIMERYQVTVHKESGIKNDPNDWAVEVGNPRYILDLLLSIINVSVQTVEIVEGLPKTTFC